MLGYFVVLLIIILGAVAGCLPFMTRDDIKRYERALALSGAQNILENLPYGPATLLTTENVVNNESKLRHGQ
jgi:hypothetical protein